MILVDRAATSTDIPFSFPALSKRISVYLAAKSATSLTLYIVESNG